MKTPRVVASVCAAVLAAGAVAQEPGQSAPAPVRDALAKLNAEYEAAQAAYRQRYAELRASPEWQAAVKAQDRAAQQKLVETLEQVDRAAFGERALELADGCTGEDQVPALCWVVLNAGDVGLVRQAVAGLRERHLKSEGLAEMLERGYALRVLGADEGSMFLDLVVAENPHALPRAWALYWKAQPMLRSRNLTEETRGEAMELLAQAAELAKGTPAEDRIAAPLFEQQRLQIGMVAPDIEGADTDGTPFKLSDYRGKVVVLDFWGFW